MQCIDFQDRGVHYAWIIYSFHFNSDIKFILRVEFYSAGIILVVI